MGIVGIPMAGFPAPDAFEKNLMIAILSQCGLSQERIRLQEEQITPLRCYKRSGVYFS